MHSRRELFSLLSRFFLKSPSVVGFATTVCLLAVQSPALRAANTSLTLNPSNNGAPYLAHYSEGILVTAALQSDVGPVSGERVAFLVEQEGDPATRFLLADPITDGNGLATARLTFVDGRYGGQTFVAQGAGDIETGKRYRITARYAGRGAASPEACANPDDAVLCGSEGTIAAFLGLEFPTVSLDPGLEVRLGESVTLRATLLDPDGIAAEAGSATDGDAPAPVVGASVGFFYDVDGNGSPSLNERIGIATTNDDGVASLSFTADPQFVNAGIFENGIHAQYGGDTRYTLAGDAGRFTIFTAPPVAASTLLSATPETIPADGSSVVALSAILVDAFGNQLDVNADPVLVRFETDLGTLLDRAEQDPLSGFYVQELRAPVQTGTATVRVFIDGDEGPSIQVNFERLGGGICSDVAGRPSDSGWILLTILGGFLVVLPRARRRTSSV